MGDGKPKANFIVAEVKKDNMVINGDYVSVENYDVLPRNLIESNQIRFTIHNTKAIRKLVKNKYFLINKKKTYLIIIIIFLIIFYLIYRIRKNEKKS